MVRKIAILTGSRSDYGFLRPIIKLIEKDADLDYELIVTNMHLLHEFGYSIKEIKADGFKIAETIHNTLDGYNHQTMVKSLGIFLIQIPEILARIKPDILLVPGDRGEALVAAIAGAHMCIPVAHIQAGDVSGNIDDATRHAITRYAHIHFSAHEKAMQRLISTGEQDFRVFNTGDPRIDDLNEYVKNISKEDVYNKFSLDPTKPVFLIIQHSVTGEYNDVKRNTEAVFRAVCDFGAQTVVIFPNSDAGNREVRSVIDTYSRPYIKLYRNLPQKDYAGLMKISSVMIGNSSGGIIEAATFKLPVVNIGGRQEGRAQNKNIINVGYDSEEIKIAIKKAISREFREGLADCTNIYGDGNSAEKIVKVLKEITIDEKLLIKKLSY